MTSGPVDEQLSAWLDDELPPAEAELLARRLSQDPDRRALLARYGLIGECLRTGRSPLHSALAMSQRVSVALESAAAPVVNPPRNSFRRGGRGLFAVAAAAILAAVLLTVEWRPPAVTAPSVQTAAFTPVVNRAAAIRIEGPAEASLSPRRLTGYLVRHGEYSGFLSAKLTDSHIVNNRAYSRLASMSEPPSQ